MKQRVIHAVEGALQRLIKEDAYLMLHDVNERSLSHRLAMHLQAEVDRWGEAWHVDCEYNRDIAHGDYYAKRLRLTNDERRGLAPRIDDEHAATVFPDVIVHRRGTSSGEGGNLLVIEVKKSSSRDTGDFDRRKKLPGFCKQLGYQHAVFVLLQCGNEPDYDLEWICLSGSLR